MVNFWEWLLAEGPQQLVPADVLKGYDAEFRRAFEDLIKRTTAPASQDRLRELLDCPIRDRYGRCRQFADYIVASLVKNGIHRRYDIEAALSYVAEKMLHSAGGARTTLFGGFEDRGQTPGFNPIQARFLSFLQFAVNNIKRGRIPRLALAAHRPPGTVSIGQGRQRAGEEGAPVVSPEAIPARRSDDAELGEMIEDITLLLRRKEPAWGFPFVALFRAMLGGMTGEEQRRHFGDHKTRAARQVIAQTIQEYGESTGNYRLLGLLRRMKEPERRTGRQAKISGPKPTDKQRDYASILSVLDRFDRPVGSADLGKYRRRWLDYLPRQPSSGARNRLEEVLAAMVREGALRAIRTSKGAYVYEPGERADEYRQGAATAV